ncbi:MAG: hypothetical protein WKF48_12030 [Solirubrobacteraceae bacterium]
MMLRNLIDEVRNRRILALAALGVLVALALPLLFLKSAPEGAPEANSAAPAAATEAKLPARAARLLATTDAGAPGGRAKGSAQDPFAPPSSYRAAAAAAANGAGAAAKSSGDAGQSSAGTSTSSSATSTKPIPVVIQDGSSSKESSNASKSNSRSNSNSKSTITSTLAVDIRFGKKKDSPIKRAIPRNKGFYIHGKLVAVFVKYSPSRKKAIFAVAPGLHITGPASSRVTDNVRYVDIPVGSHAWLTMVTANRTIVKRRLDVVRTRSVSSAKAIPAAVSAESACLLGKLSAMKPGDRFLDRDACEL